MRRFIGLATIGVLALAGCAKKDEVTINTPDGQMKVSTEGNKTTLETEKGKVEVNGDGKEGTWTMTDEKGNKSTVSTGEDVDLSKLGIDVYEGAKVNKGKGGMSTVDTPEGKMTSAILSTPDKTNKVIAFYKGKLKDPKAFEGPNAGMVTGKDNAGNEVQIAVARNEEDTETTMTITVVEKKK